MATEPERDVALKFLPAHLSASEDDKARFIQEAKAAATLDHANICTIYSIEEREGPASAGAPAPNATADKQLFIVMQLVEGQLLRDRISGMSQKQAIETGIQVAEGLAAAHEKGVVHRDIKPENIMLQKDGVTKIMDFGLAKLKGVSRLTKEGSTVGTAGYMSPEQVQGEDADHRSDIFSLGVLLYEMLTGQLPFKGVHETAIAYEIVNVDAAPMAVVKPEIDPALDAVILECLEKDPRERTQAAGQVALDLKRYRRESSRNRASRVTAARPVQRAGAPGSDSDRLPSVPSGKTGLSPALTAALAVLMLILGFGLARLLNPQETSGNLIRASIEMPEGVRYASGLGGHSVISPDGSMIAFCGIDSLEQRKLYLRRLSSTEARALRGTEDATYPFWSPDSRSIGFFAEGKVRTIEAEGGPVLTLADAPFGRGGSWSTTGGILYSPSVTDPNLFTVPATGGMPRKVTSFDSTGARAPRFPFFLPDGGHFLFSLLELGEGVNNRGDIHIGSMSGDSAKFLLEDSHYPLYNSGFLFFLRQGILMSQPFDPDSRSLSGKPYPLQGNINSWLPRSKGDYSVSESGVMVYVGGRGSQSIPSLTGELVWVGSDGSERTIMNAGVFTRPILSPDKKKILYDEIDDQAQMTSIWIYDLMRKVKTRVTFGPGASSSPAWSRDGQTIYYNTELDGSKANIMAKRADGTGEAERIAFDPGGIVGYYPIEVSPSGRFLLIRLRNESMGELATVDLQETTRPIPVTRLGIKASGARFSPDGKWIVYQTGWSGTSRVYVSSFMGVAGKWQVSARGGGPLWLKDRIVFYAGDAGRYESVSVSFAAGSPTFGEPKDLFPGGAFSNTFIQDFSPSEDSFLAYNPGRAGSSAHLSVVINWQKLLETR